MAENETVGGAAALGTAVAQPSTPVAQPVRASWTTSNNSVGIVQPPHVHLHIDFQAGTKPEAILAYLREAGLPSQFINTDGFSIYADPKSGAMRCEARVIGAEEPLANIIAQMPADLAAPEVKAQARYKLQKSGATLGTQQSPVEPSPTTPASTSARAAYGRAAGSGAAAGIDLINIGTAVHRGDSDAALAATGSLVTNSAAAVDGVMAANGASSGFVGKALGPVGMIATAVVTKAQIDRIKAENPGDAKSLETKAWAGYGASMAAGVTAGTVAGTKIGAAVGAPGGPVGMAAGAVVGGTVGVVTGVTVGVIDHAIDDAMYGAEDRRFKANLETMPNLVGLTHGKFREQLADPKTGEIDLNNMKTLNKAALLLALEEDKQMKTFKNTDSRWPRWIRGDESVGQHESARADLKIIENARSELKQQTNQVLDGQKLARLDKNGDGRLEISDLDRNNDGRLTKKDEAAIISEVGDKKLGEAFISNLRAQGITFNNQPVSQPIAQAVPGGQNKQHTP